VPSLRSKLQEGRSVALREQRMAKLHCNNCGHEWEGLVWHEAVSGDKRGVFRWVVASGDAFGGASCPNCGSDLIGARRR